MFYKPFLKIKNQTLSTSSPPWLTVTSHAKITKVVTQQIENITWHLSGTRQNEGNVLCGVLIKSVRIGLEMAKKRVESTTKETGNISIVTRSRLSTKYNGIMKRNSGSSSKSEISEAMQHGLKSTLKSTSISSKRSNGNFEDPKKEASERKHLISRTYP